VRHRPARPQHYRNPVQHRDPPRRADPPGHRRHRPRRGHGAGEAGQSKGNKDRRIPIGERALYWIDRYLSEWRPQRPRASHSKLLYLSEKGYALRSAGIGQKIRDYKKKAGISKPGGCHLFRHAMATHMLDNGADIRYIQEMLGHSSLSSTQIYTKVSNQALKEVHRQAHPAAQVEQKEGSEEAETTKKD